MLDGNGLVIHMQDPGALVDAIVEILSEAPKRALMRKASLKVADKYSWNALGAAYFEMYQAISQSQFSREAVSARSWT